MTRRDKGFFRTIATGLVRLALTIAVLFIIAGRIDYWQGWVFTGFIAFMIVISLSLFSQRGELLQERMWPGAGAKQWDKLLTSLLSLSFTGTIVIGGLDAGRWHRTSSIPFPLYVAACVVFLAALLIFFGALRENRFFSTIVRIQQDRGHVVVRSGLYRFVRHPGYVGVLLMAASMPLVLGSLWALIPGAFVAGITILRTALEDATLRRELPGYPAYAAEVKYRLFPGIW